MKNAKSNNLDTDNIPCCIKPGYLLIKNGKKYVFGLIVIKLVIIWYIYSQYNDILFFVPKTSGRLQNRNFSLYNTSLFHVPLTKEDDMTSYYIEISTNKYCFISGINLKTSRSKKKCECMPGWHGMDCGIPEAIWESNYMQGGKREGLEIRRRIIPRRIISTILYANEGDLLEIVVQETYSAIDVFLVVDEISTNSTSLYTKLKKGFLSEFQSKIMPISNKKISKKTTSLLHWSLLMLKTLWINIWNHITDFRPDDLFLFSHVSSILSKDVLMFLKLYDGYPEPFLFELQFVIKDFNKQILTNSSNASLMHKLFFRPLGCSFQYLYFRCYSDFYKLFSDICFENIKSKEKYEKNYWKIEKWIIGTQDFPSGWQCYLCSKICDIKEYVQNHMWLIEAFNLSPSIVNNTENLELTEYDKWYNEMNFNLTFSKLNNHFVPESIQNGWKLSSKFTC